MTAQTLRSDLDWMFNSFYILFGTITFASALRNVIRAITELLLERKAKRIIEDGLTRKMIRALDIHGDGVITK